MSPIASMVARMLEAGVPHDAIVLAVETAEQVASCRVESRVDTQVDKRRAWDREYRRRKRNCPPDIHPNPPDIHPTSTFALIYEGKKEEVIETKKEGSKRKVGPIPLDWIPPSRSLELARELGLSISEIEPRFRDYLASSGKQYADYDAGFCNFVRNTPKFNGAQNAASGKDRSYPASRPRQSGGDAMLAAMAGELAKCPESRLFQPTDDPRERGADPDAAGIDRTPRLRAIGG